LEGGGMSRRTKWLTSWVPHRLELYLSPSWRLAPVPLRRILERIEIEHMRHGGQNNGALFVSYGQFEEAKVSRRKIAAALALGEALGLLEIIRPSSEPAGDLRGPSAYRLTYLPARGASRPGDEWKQVSEARAAAMVDAFHHDERDEVSDRKRRAA